MATKITRDLSQINAEIRTLNQSVKTTNAELREVRKQSKFDPSSVTLISKKYQILARQVEENTRKITLHREKQEELDRQLAAGTIQYSKYQKEIAATNKEINKAENSIARLTVEIKNQEQELRAARWEKWTAGLDKAQAVAKKFSQTALAVTAAVTAMTVTFAKVGAELDDTSKKLNTNAEALQINREIYNKFTSSASEYDAALASLDRAMRQIARGGGQAYLTVLNQLGISLSDLQGKDTGAQLDVITNALRNVTDATERTHLATMLLRDNGRAVAVVAGETTEAINAYTQKLIENGIITNEQAEAAGKISDQFDQIKLRLQSNTAELVVAFMPAIETLVGILQNHIIPLISTVANWLDSIGSGGQKVLLVVLAALIILPKLIGVIKGISEAIQILKLSTYGQAAATGALSAATIPLQPIFLAVAAAILVVIGLLATFSSRARKAANDAKNLSSGLSSIAGDYGKLGSEVGVTTTSIAQSSSTQTLNINLSVESSGDSPISNENAKLVAINLADIVSDQIERKWGAKINTNLR